MVSAADSSGDGLDALRAAVAGHYTVERLLGQGGMGAVYVGRDVTLDRPVAIKVIKPEVASADLIRDRFLQEARSVAKLRHPNIVSVYSAGESAGLLYFAMELVEGQSLRELLESSGRLPHDQAERIVGEIALALDHAHAHGLVHRDVKPDNILIEAATGKALLTDFGVARAAQAGAEHGLTQTGMIVGSPRYMSPEQISGDTGIDGRADLYALALVGYELYSGEPVVASGSVSSMIYKHMSETPAPLVTAVPGIAPRVSAAISRGLEKDPAQRWQTGADFAKSLRGETPLPPGAARAASRARLAWAGAILAAVAVGGAWFAMRDGADRGNSFLIAPFEIQTGDQSVEWLREGSVNMLTLTLSQWSDLNVVDYERTLSLLDAAELGEKSRLSAEDAFDLASLARASRVVMGQVLTTADSLIVIAKLYDVASKKSDRQAQASIALGGDPRPLFDELGQKLLSIEGFGRASTVQLAKATTSNLEAYRAYLDGVRLLNSWRLIEADREFVRAIALDSTFALAYHKRSLGLGWSQSGGNDYIAAAQEAFALVSRLPPREQSLVRGHYHFALASGATLQLDTATARREYDAAIAEYRQLIDPPRGDSLVAEGWYGLADAYFHRRQVISDWNEATRHATQSLHGFNRTLAIDSAYHLAYSHLVQLYNAAASGQSAFLLDGDSAIVLDSARSARLGVARIAALRQAARTRGVAISRAWARTDEHSNQPFFQLAESFQSAGMPDSAKAVLREALAEPRVGAPLSRLMLLGLEEASDDSTAAATLDYVLENFTADSLRVISPSSRIHQTGQLMSSAALRGRAADVERAGALLFAVDPLLPLTTHSSKPMIDYLVTGLRLAMGDSMTAERRRILLSSNEWIDPMSPQIRNGARQGTIGIPYLAFLITHDAAFMRQVQEWSNSPAGFTELEAIVALDRGDTARARAIAQTFTSSDSLRSARFSLAGLRTIARAEILERLGDDRRAAETYEAMSVDRINRMGVVEPGLAVWVRSLATQGRLWARLGEREKAIAAYEEFLRRWRDADGAAARQVASVRQELARLRDARQGR